MDNGNIITLTLMNKNNKVIDFDYDTELNVIYKIYHSYKENEKYAPLGIIDQKVGINRNGLLNWFKNRLIPETRDCIDEYLKKYNGDYNLFMIDIISKRHGFNLSDQYWVKLPNEEIKWEDGNYFDNSFSEDTGKKIINKKTFSSSIPSSSTNGNLFKKWIIEDNDRFLLKGGTTLKQEPFNEVVATKLYERLLSDDIYVKYELYKEKNSNKIFSKCKCFITRDTELISAWDIIKTTKKKGNENDFDFFIRCSDILKIPNVRDYMNKMLICDYILGNSDRHYNNFGVIRNVNTLEYVGMAPIFDNGNSLGIIRNDQDKLTMAPFYKDPKKQLELVNDLSFFDIEKLDGFLLETKSILRKNALLSEVYISRQIEELKKRINDVVEYKKRCYKEFNKNRT